MFSLFIVLPIEIYLRELFQWFIAFQNTIQRRATPNVLNELRDSFQVDFDQAYRQRLTAQFCLLCCILIGAPCYVQKSVYKTFKKREGVKAFCFYEKECDIY